MTTPRYESPFRPIYEWVSIGAWAAAGVCLEALSMAQSLPSWPLRAATMVAMGLALRSVPAALALRRRRERMKGQPIGFIDATVLQQLVADHPDKVWMGKGFLWSQDEAQRAYELGRINPDSLAPPNEQGMGRPWIHAMGDTEDDLFIPIAQLDRHMLIFGTTGSGKTRFFENLIYQAVLRKESVIIIDPKGDKDLCEAARAACVAAGAPERFVYFHPAYPMQSARIDALRNFNRPTELATRIANLLSSESGSDAFIQFGQMVMNNIVQGLLLVDSKPSVLSIRRMIDGGLPGLVVRACEAWFSRMRPVVWEKEVAPYKKKKDASDESLAMAYIQYYREEYQERPDQASSELEGLFNSFEHDKTHASKMMASLMPLLNMLTSGELGKLLSPDATAAKDPRKITDFSRIIAMGQVAYVALDCLSDAMVGSAIGSLFLSDLATVAGDRYNYVDQKDLKPVNVFIDEAAEVVNKPTIQLLNKGRGARIRMCLATQTYADFTSRLGGEEETRMVLGNINNMFTLQVTDSKTQEYVTENFPQTVLRRIELAQSGSSGSDADLSYGGSGSEKLAEEAGPLFQPQLLGCLPTLEYFANVAGGRILKGRVPILRKELPVSREAA